MPLRVTHAPDEYRVSSKACLCRAGGANERGVLKAAELHYVQYLAPRSSCGCQRCAADGEAAGAAGAGATGAAIGSAPSKLQCTEFLCRHKLKPMSVPRWSCGGATLPDGRPAVFGGSDGAGRGPGATQTILTLASPPWIHCTAPFSFPNPSCIPSHRVEKVAWPHRSRDTDVRGLAGTLYPRGSQEARAPVERGRGRIRRAQRAAAATRWAMGAAPRYADRRPYERGTRWA